MMMASILKQLRPSVVAICILVGIQTLCYSRVAVHANPNSSLALLSRSNGASLNASAPYTVVTKDLKPQTIVLAWPYVSYSSDSLGAQLFNDSICIVIGDMDQLVYKRVGYHQPIMDTSDFRVRVIMQIVSQIDSDLPLTITVLQRSDSTAVRNLLSTIPDIQLKDVSFSVSLHNSLYMADASPIIMHSDSAPYYKTVHFNYNELRPLDSRYYLNNYRIQSEFQDLGFGILQVAFDGAGTAFVSGSAFESVMSASAGRAIVTGTDSSFELHDVQKTPYDSTTAASILATLFHCDNVVVLPRLLCGSNTPNLDNIVRIVNDSDIIVTTFDSHFGDTFYDKQRCQSIDSTVEAVYRRGAHPYRLLRMPAVYACDQVNNLSSCFGFSGSPLNFTNIAVVGSYVFAPVYYGGGAVADSMSDYAIESYKLFYPDKKVIGINMLQTLVNGGLEDAVPSYRGEGLHNIIGVQYALCTNHVAQHVSRVDASGRTSLTFTLSADSLLRMSNVHLVYKSSPNGDWIDSVMQKQAAEFSVVVTLDSNYAAALLYYFRYDDDCAGPSRFPASSDTLQFGEVAAVDDTDPGDLNAAQHCHFYSCGNDCRIVQLDQQSVSIVGLSLFDILGRTIPCTTDFRSHNECLIHIPHEYSNEAMLCRVRLSNGVVCTLF